MSLAAGNLDRRVTLERYTAVLDDYGGEVRTWIALATVWARVEQRTGYERSASNQVQAGAVTLFTIRWQQALADLNPKDRILYDGRYWDIESVAELGRRVGFQIAARAATDGDA